jgi:hypothetical protein
VGGAFIDLPGSLDGRDLEKLVITMNDLGEFATYPDARMLSIPVGGGRLALPPMPSGKHRFEVIDGGGAVIEAVDLTVSQGQGLAWPSEKN